MEPRKTRFAEDESGATLVLMAMCIAILIGFLGLVLDVGMLYGSRQRIQIAADAAAKAAALDYLNNQSATSAVSQGQAAATANGYTASSSSCTISCTTVTINVPPAGGPAASTAGYAEAIITAPNPTAFMGVFGFNSVGVTARAVAGAPMAGTACIWLSGINGVALYLQGSATIDSPNCGVFITATGNNSIDQVGGGGTVTASFVDAEGNPSPSHWGGTAITSNVPPRTNPWGNLSGPSVPSGCNITYSGSTLTGTSPSGASGSSTSPVVCFTNPGGVTLTNVTLPGASSGSDVVYVFEYGVTLSGTVTLGSGTYNPSTKTFLSTSGAVMEIGGTCSTCTLNQGNATLNIYSPTYGSYNGIAILQPATNTNQLQVQFGNSGETLDGYIYAPGAEVYLQDNGGGITASGIVAGELYDKSSTVTIAGYDSANSSTTPNRQISMVE